jgi:hypothetical protein
MVSSILSFWEIPDVMAWNVVPWRRELESSRHRITSLGGLSARPLAQSFR